MKFSTTKILAAALLLATGTQQAFAAAPTASGPTASTNTAGSEVANTASVTYSVGGVVQAVPVDSNQAKFTVDRLVNVTVASDGNTNVSPGATAQGLAFTVTNNTNSKMDYVLTAANVAAGDQFDTTGAFSYYVDTNDNGVYDAGTDTAVANSGGVYYLDEMTPNQVVRVFVVANIPNPTPALVNGDQGQVTLLATAHDADGTTPGTLGALTTALDDTQANTAGVDNVFGDLAGTATGDTAKHGDHSATGAFVVASASITVAKRSGVIEDPINGTAAAGKNPKAIPGATMVYCIAVTNGSSTVPATAVTVSDGIPVGTTYVPGSIRVVAAAVTNCDYTALALGDAMNDGNAVAETLNSTPAGTAGDFGQTTAGAVTTVTDLPVSATTTTIFEVTIN